MWAVFECRVECSAYFTVVIIMQILCSECHEECYVITMECVKTECGVERMKCKTANTKCVFDTSRRERTIENANDKMQNELLEYKMHLLKNKMR